MEFETCKRLHVSYSMLRKNLLIHVLCQQYCSSHFSMARLIELDLRPPKINQRNINSKGFC